MSEISSNMAIIEVEPLRPTEKPTEITMSMPIDLELFIMLLSTAKDYAGKRKKQISMKTQDGKTIINIEA